MHHGHEHSMGCGHVHSHEHTHTHEHTHDGVTHSHDHAHLHEHDAAHTHSHDCGGQCAGCAGGCEHTPMEELLALMKYMASHNAAHANELAQLAMQLEKAGSHAAYEQVMAAVSDYEKGNMRLQAVLASLDIK